MDINKSVDSTVRDDLQSLSAASLLQQPNRLSLNSQVNGKVSKNGENGTQANFVTKKQYYNEMTSRCSICSLKLGDELLTIRCKSCGLAAHADCFETNDAVRKSNFVCISCELSLKKLYCKYCPNTGGLLIKIGKEKFAHILCCKFRGRFSRNPNIYKRTEYKKTSGSLNSAATPLDTVNNICDLCSLEVVRNEKGENRKRTVKCFNADCFSSVHATCAHMAGLLAIHKTNSTKFEVFCQPECASNNHQCLLLPAYQFYENPMSMKFSVPKNFEIDYTNEKTQPQKANIVDVTSPCSIMIRLMQTFYAVLCESEEKVFGTNKTAELLRYKRHSAFVLEMQDCSQMLSDVLIAFDSEIRAYNSSLSRTLESLQSVQQQHGQNHQPSQYYGEYSNGMQQHNQYFDRN